MVIAARPTLSPRSKPSSTIMSGQRDRVSFDSRQRCVSMRGFRSRQSRLAHHRDGEPAHRKVAPEARIILKPAGRWNADSLCTRGNSARMAAALKSTTNGCKIAIPVQATNPHPAARQRCARGARARQQSRGLDGDGTPDTAELAWYFEYDPRFGSPATACGKKLCVGNLPCSARGPRRVNLPGWLVRQHADHQGSALGGIESAKVITDRDTGRSKRLWFCTSATDPRGHVTTAVFDDSGNFVCAFAKARALVSRWDGTVAAFGYNALVS